MVLVMAAQYHRFPLKISLLTACYKKTLSICAFSASAKFLLSYAFLTSAPFFAVLDTETGKGDLKEQWHPSPG